MHSFTFAWDRATHVRACRAAAKHGERGWGSRLSRWGMGAAAVFWVLVLAGMGPGERSALLLALLPWAAIIVLCLLFFQFGLPYVQAWDFARTSRDVAHPLIAKMDEEGYALSCFTGASHVRWEGIRKVVETQDFLLCYFTPKCALYLPKTAVPSASALDEVRREIASRLGERAGSSPPPRRPTRSLAPRLRGSA